jgi:hypothetical protein
MKVRRGRRSLTAFIVAANKKPLSLQHHQMGDSGALFDYVLPKAHNHVHYPWHQRVAEEGRL